VVDIYDYTISVVTAVLFRKTKILWIRNVGQYAVMQ